MRSIASTLRTAAFPPASVVADQNGTDGLDEVVTVAHVVVGRDRSQLLPNPPGLVGGQVGGTADLLQGGLAAVACRACADREVIHVLLAERAQRDRLSPRGAANAADRRGQDLGVGGDQLGDVGRLRVAGRDRGDELRDDELERAERQEVVLYVVVFGDDQIVAPTKAVFGHVVVAVDEEREATHVLRAHRAVGLQHERLSARDHQLRGREAQWREELAIVRSLEDQPAAIPAQRINLEPCCLQDLLARAELTHSLPPWLVQ